MDKLFIRIAWLKIIGASFLTKKPGSRYALCLFTILSFSIVRLSAQSVSPVSETIYNTIFRAGAASTKITPPVGCIMGNSYGITISEGVHDELFARTLVFERSGEKAAFIALDLISIPYVIAVETRKLIAQRTGIPVTSIIMTATHAHAGPQMNPLFWKAVGGLPAQKSKEYLRDLPEMISRSVELAQSRLQAVNVSVGTIRENTINFNRRFLMKDGSFRMNPGKGNPNSIRPVGPVDPDVSVVYFETFESKPLAILVNFALHPAIVGGNRFSADFPAVIAELLANVKGDDMVTIYTNGTSGNINNIDVNWPGQPEGYEELTRIGTILAADVLKALPTLHPIEVNSLKVHTQSVELPVPPVQPRDIKWAEEVMAKYGKPDSPPFDDIVKAWRIIDLNELKGGDKTRFESTTTVPLTDDGGELKSEVQAIVLGNELALVGFPGDAFVELGLAIKQNSPFPYTIVNEQSGNGTLSYVPNRKAITEGGYEGESARFSPGGGEILVDAVTRILIDLFPY